MIHCDRLSHYASGNYTTILAFIKGLDNMMVCVRSGVKDDNAVSRNIRHCCCEHAELLLIYAGFVHLKLETL